MATGVAEKQADQAAAGEDDADLETAPDPRPEGGEQALNLDEFQPLQRRQHDLRRHRREEDERDEPRCGVADVRVYLSPEQRDGPEEDRAQEGDEDGPGHDVLSLLLALAHALADGGRDAHHRHDAEPRDDAEDERVDAERFGTEFAGEVQRGTEPQKRRCDTREEEDDRRLSEAHGWVRGSVYSPSVPLNKFLFSTLLRATSVSAPFCRGWV